MRGLGKGDEAESGAERGTNENVMSGIATHRACLRFSRAVQEDWVRT